MSFATILVDREGPISTITVNRPDKRNALNTGVRTEIVAALDEIRDDPAVRVLVVTGAGDSAFVAGADLAEFAARNPAEQRAAMAGPTVFDAVAAFPKPTLAMINGFALGGGCELALACDIRIAADTARLGQPEINLGLIPGGGGTQRLPRLVGTGQALRLVLSGDIIDAAEALRIGLLDMVVPVGELRDATMSLARRIAARSPVALGAAKSAIRAAAGAPGAGAALERELFLACFASDDGREGVAAFLHKRAPDFQGR